MNEDLKEVYVKQMLLPKEELALQTMELMTDKMILKDNWNKLKEWIKVRDNIGLEKICLEDIVYKMVALEKGSDSK